VLEKALRLLNKKVPATRDSQPAVDDIECADSFHLPSVHDHEDDGEISIGSSIDSDETDSTINSIVSEDINKFNNHDLRDGAKDGDPFDFAILE